MVEFNTTIRSVTLELRIKKYIFPWVGIQYTTKTIIFRCYSISPWSLYRNVFCFASRRISYISEIALVPPRIVLYSLQKTYKIFTITTIFTIIWRGARCKIFVVLTKRWLRIANIRFHILLRNFTLCKLYGNNLKQYSPRTVFVILLRKMYLSIKGWIYCNKCKTKFG